MSLHITVPGPLSTIQDLGRFGYMKSGFSPSGAMDTQSAILANLILGNFEELPVLEMTMMGITGTFQQNSVIALTGGDFSPKLNGQAIPTNTAVPVHAGDILTLSYAAHGVRCYLAVAGGFNIPQEMGSFATNIKVALGGFQGRALKRGDILPFNTPANTLPNLAMRTLPYSAPSDMEAKVRVVLGPQDDMFTQNGIDTFFSSIYTVTPESDRMGMRLDGQPIAAKESSDILSDGIALGAVQIPASGTPIIMLADRQTVGGYAKIGTVISTDIPLLAQLKPGAKVTFENISVTKAQEIYKETYQQTQNIKKQFSLRAKYI